MRAGAARSARGVTRVDAEPGTPLDPAAMADAIAPRAPALVAFVHARDLDRRAPAGARRSRAAAREAGALVLLDCVTSLGGVPVELDAWGVDAAYSGTQKCLSCPPGLSPVSSRRARARAGARARRTPLQSWYLDVTLLAGYFGGERVYHHTAPISAIVGARRGVAHARRGGHADARRAPPRAPRRRCSRACGRSASRPLVEARLAPADAHLAAAAGARDCARRGRGCAARCSTRYGIEVGGGLGKLAGQIWRVGLMGENARVIHVEALLFALARVLG